MGNETVTVSLGKDSGKKQFDSFDVIATWLAEEEKFWSWMRQGQWTNEKAQIYQPFAQFQEGINNQLREAGNIKQTNAQSGKEASYTQQFDSIRVFFSRYYDDQNGIPSDSPVAKFILQLQKEQGDGVATGACGFFMDIRLPYGNLESFRGALAASLFRLGIKDAATNEKAALEQLRITWGTNFQVFANSLNDESEKHKDLNTAASGLLVAQKANYDELLGKKGKELNDLVEKSRGDWSKLKQTYDSELALRAPVFYWRKKTATGLKLAWSFALVLIAAVPLFAWFLYNEFKWLIEPTPVMQSVVRGTNNIALTTQSVVQGTQSHPENWHPEYWKLAVSIAFGLLGVWVLRIFVRLFLSYVHLHTDASERVTMIQTYLALRKRGKITAQDESIILGVLFRPSATGLVKDDAVPLTIVEAMTKLGRG